MRANTYDQFLEWERTIADEKAADGTLVRWVFVDGSFIEYDKNDPHGRPYFVTIGNCCDTFRTLKAATWHLWEEWAQHNMEGEQ